MTDFEIHCAETGRLVATVAPIMTENGSTALVCTAGTTTRTFAMGALENVHMTMVDVMAWIEAIRP
jgi:hypothetical protein